MAVTDLLVLGNLSLLLTKLLEFHCGKESSLMLGKSSIKATIVEQMSTIKNLRTANEVFRIYDLERNIRSNYNRKNRGH